MELKDRQMQPLSSRRAHLVITLRMVHTEAQFSQKDYTVKEIISSPKPLSMLFISVS
jgi:hypothetical protein